MKPAKLRQITRVREQARHLGRDPHVDVCDCCHADLLLIEEYADSPCAEAWLKQIARRITASRSPNWKAGGTAPRPPGADGA